LVAGLRGIAGQIDADSVRLDQSYAKVAAELDRMSFTGYLDKYAKLIPRTLGASPYGSDRAHRIWLRTRTGLRDRIGVQPASIDGRRIGRA